MTTSKKKLALILAVALIILVCLLALVLVPPPTSPPTPPPTYTLTIIETTGGTTHPAPGNYTYPEDTLVTVNATAFTGYIFNHWELDGSKVASPSSIDVTMDANHTLHAVFALITHTLTISKTAGGTTSPAPGDHIYDHGTEVQVNATANTGYFFDHWELDAVDIGDDNPTLVTMNTNHTLHAVFTQITYTLTITTTTGGTTNPSPNSYVYSCCTNVSVTAIPDACYQFDHWELDSVWNYSHPITVHMDANHTLKAVFVQKTFWLAIQVDGTGTTSPSPGAYEYNCCEYVSVQAMETDPCWRFDHWELDSTPAGSANSYTVTMNDDHTLHAIFKEVPPVGGHAVPIDKPHFLAPKISLAPGIGLAFTFLAAMALIITLIRRRNKHSSGNLEGSVA